LKTYQNSAIDGLRYFSLVCRAAFEIHQLRTQAPTRVSRRWPSESRRMLGDPGINLVASRDSPWHGSKKADNEVRTEPWISERVDRERAAAEAFEKVAIFPLTQTPTFRSAT
jgi:hypothetical protein